jgi:hypothetical protein
VLAVVNAQAAIANPLIIGFVILVLAMLWKPHPACPSGICPVLVPTLAFVQFFAFVSDGFLGNQNLVFNMVSTLCLGTGLFLMKTATSTKS